MCFGCNDSAYFARARNGKESRLFPEKNSVVRKARPATLRRVNRGLRDSLAGVNKFPAEA